MEYIRRRFTTRHNKPKVQQQNLIQIQNKKIYEVFKNRLFLTSFINLLIYVDFVFSMSYYNWGQIVISTFISKDQTQSQRTTYTFFFNFLYVKQPGDPLYHTFSNIKQRLCRLDDIICLSTIEQLSFIGYLTFGIFLIGSIFQLIDIFYMIYFLTKKKQKQYFEQKKKDNLIHILTLGHYIVGITLSVFGYFNMQAKITYGISFYVFIAGVSIFIIILIYQQVALYKLYKQDLILNLIQGEKKLSSKMNVTIQMSQLENDNYI